MPTVNPGPAVTQTQQTVEVQTPVNTMGKPVVQGANALRLLAVARAVPLSGTGDVVIMPIINSTAWAATTVVTANGKVAGVAGSIATASIGIFQAPASGGAVVKTQAALASNSTANSSIAIAANVVNLAYTAQSLYINVGTALANATVDVFVYGYDQS